MAFEALKLLQEKCGVDPDGDELTYSIVEGIVNHAMFMIINNMLHLNK